MGVAADEEFYFCGLPGGQRLGTYKSTNPEVDGFTAASTNARTSAEAVDSGSGHATIAYGSIGI